MATRRSDSLGKPDSRRTSSWRRLLRLPLRTIAAAAFCLAAAAASTEDAVAEEREASYVGSASCGKCHRREYDDWSRSHHFAATQPATPETVLGDFDAETSQEAAGFGFRRRDDDYFVSAEDATGERLEFRVTHTLGIAPLQQYLVGFDDGRVQALTAAWDSRPLAHGGQRWLDLQPDASPGEPLHWTGRAYNWNAMCADCHSTGVEKRYDPATGRYQTTYRDLTVGCEACHGPGSRHIAVPTDATASAPAAAALTACAPCHSRRRQLREGFRPDDEFLDYYQPAAVAPPLYFADGQIRDEVYVFGSFAQSRMHGAGVTCMDCHDPHTAALKRMPAQLCTHCHAPQGPGRHRFPMLAAKSYGKNHHGHDTVSCVDCHMPSRIYMEVDARRDHRLGMPRPDLTVLVGTPNACGTCHDNRDAAWAVAAVGEIFGRPAARPEDALVQGHLGRLAAESPLVDLVRGPGTTAIVRARALDLLAKYESTHAMDALAAALRDPRPLVRHAAAAQVGRLGEGVRWYAVKGLLADPARAVRFEALPAALPYLAQRIDKRERALVLEVRDDYLATGRLHADQPEGHTHIAATLGRSGDLAGAEKALAAALTLEPRWMPALLNLAAIYQRTGRAGEVGAVLARAAAIDPPNAEASYAHGLWLARAGRGEAAAQAIRRASELAPYSMNYAYAHALAQNAIDRPQAAIDTLTTAYERFGGHASLLHALATLHRDQGRFAEAESYAVELVDRFGADYVPLLQQIRHAAERRSVPGVPR